MYIHICYILCIIIVSHFNNCFNINKLIQQTKIVHNHISDINYMLILHSLQESCMRLRAELVLLIVTAELCLARIVLIFSATVLSVCISPLLSSHSLLSFSQLPQFPTLPHMLSYKLMMQQERNIYVNT